MKVRSGVSRVRALVAAALVVAFASTLTLSAPAQASAVTRDQVIKRANSWVKKRVPYSQRRYHKGYRQDCSGFVSMAWKLKRSYTTRTLSSQGKRIKVSSLKPGDAVLVPGRHVSIFGGWKNKKARTFYALEQTTWGSHAKKRVRKIPSGAKALRYKDIKPKPRKKAVAKATAPASILPPPTVNPVINQMLDGPAVTVLF